MASSGVTVTLAPSTAKEDVVHEIEASVRAALSAVPGTGQVTIVREQAPAPRGSPRSAARPGHQQHPRRRERQGRRRQVHRRDQPGARPDGARPAHRPHGRRRLRPEHPAHARHHRQGPHRGGQAAPAGAPARPLRDLDGHVPGRRDPGHLARPDADEARRRVPAQLRLGRARRPGPRPAARHRRRPAHADPAGPAHRRGHRHDAAGGGAGGRPARAPDVPAGRGAGPRGDREHELPPLPRLRRASRALRTRRRRRHGARAGRAVPGRDPLARSVREAGDRGLPIVAAEPASPFGRAFHEIAERVLLRLREAERRPGSPVSAPS